jgi:hypothetical protein
MEAIAVFMALAFYLIPTMIAFSRGHASKWAIFAVNFLFGWSVIGWGWAFIWSLANKGASQTVIVNNHVGGRSNDLS